MSGELFVGSLITVPQGIIPLSNLLETHLVNRGITEINAVLDGNNLTAETIAALGRSAFGVDVSSQQVYVTDFNFDERDEFFAKEFGFKILPVAHIGIRDGEIETWIGPTLIPVNHPLSQRIEIGNSALVNSEGNKAQLNNREIRPNSETVSSYYVRLKVKDQAGVLAQVSQEFGNIGISIREMRQPQSKEGSDEADMAFLLWPCQTQALQSAINSLAGLSSIVISVSVPLRVFNKSK